MLLASPRSVLLNQIDRRSPLSEKKKEKEEKEKEEKEKKEKEKEEKITKEEAIQPRGIIGNHRVFLTMFPVFQQYYLSKLLRPNEYSL